MGLQITDWILCLVGLTALFSMGTAWMLLLIAFPAEFHVHAQTLYNFLEESSEVDQFTMVYGVMRDVPWRREQQFSITGTGIIKLLQQQWKHEFWLYRSRSIPKGMLYFVLHYPQYHSLIPNTVICSNGAYIGQLQKLHRLCYSSVGDEKVSLKNLVTTTVGSASLVHLEMCIIFHANCQPFTY